MHLKTNIHDAIENTHTHIISDNLRIYDYICIYIYVCIIRYIIYDNICIYIYIYVQLVDFPSILVEEYSWIAHQ